MRARIRLVLESPSPCDDVHEERAARDHRERGLPPHEDLGEHSPWQREVHFAQRLAGRDEGCELAGKVVERRARARLHDRIRTRDVEVSVEARRLEDEVGLHVVGLCVLPSVPAQRRGGDDRTGPEVSRCLHQLAAITEDVRDLGSP